jgi:hypothetical protein
VIGPTGRAILRELEREKKENGFFCRSLIKRRGRGVSICKVWVSAIFARA